MIKRLLNSAFCFIACFCLCNDVGAEVEFGDLNIEGKYTQSFSYSNYKKDSRYSRLEEGLNYSSELYIYFYEDMDDDIIFEGEFNVRKTDDDRVDRIRGVHLLSGYVSLSGRDFDITVGDVYSEFTDYTLTSSIEGLDFQVNLPRFEYHTVAGRILRKSEGSNATKYVVGQRLSYDVIKNLSIIDVFYVGGNFVYVWDDIGSIKNETDINGFNNVSMIRNSVWSLDSGLDIGENLEIRGEFAKSRFRDRANVIQDDIDDASAYMVEGTYTVDTVGELYAHYHRHDTDFNSDAGAIAADQVMYDTSFRFYPDGARFEGEVGYKQYHDNLDHSFLNTTWVKNPYYDISIRPLEERKYFKADIGLDYRRQRTSDGLSDFNDYSIDFLLSDRIANFSWRTGYDYFYSNDLSGDGHNRTDTGKVGIGYRYKRKNYSISPKLDYSLRKSVTRSGPVEKYTHNIRGGISFRVIKKWAGSVNLSYYSEHNEENGEDRDKFRMSYKVSYKVNNDLKLESSYIERITNSDQMRTDLVEQVIEGKVIYRF